LIVGELTDAVLQKLQINPDFSYADANAKLLFVHRKLNDRDIYWVNNRMNKSQELDVNFRVSGKLVEIWHAETGKTEKAAYQFDGKQTKVHLQLTANDAVFVVFGTNTSASSLTLKEKTIQTIAELKGSWDISFQKNRGAPAAAQMNELSSLSETRFLVLNIFLV